VTQHSTSDSALPVGLDGRSTALTGGAVDRLLYGWNRSTPSSKAPQRSRLVISRAISGMRIR
jgi:hypothetical protein